MKNKWLLATGLLFLLQSCIPSLHPLYTKDTLVFEEAIIGTWSDSPNQTWEFKKGDGKNYHVTYTNKDEAVDYEVHLVKLGTNYFFDFYLDEDLKNDYITPLIPSHSFAKVIWKQDKMDLYFFDYDWLEELFKQRQIRLKHEVLEEGTIILTAPSEDLQKFVQKYAHEEAAFLDPSELQRAQ